MDENSHQKTDRILEAVKRSRDETAGDTSEAEKIELVIFTLGDDYYAFKGAEVREILPCESITYVPGCPGIILGIINVRGDIESVLSLHRILGLNEAPASKKARIIMAAHGDILSGILVDTVEDVISYPADGLKRPISTMESTVREFALGGETFYEDQYVTLLDIGRIFGKLQE